MGSTLWEVGSTPWEVGSTPRLQLARESHPQPPLPPEESFPTPEEVLPLWEELAADSGRETFETEKEIRVTQVLFLFLASHLTLLGTVSHPLKEESGGEG